MPAAEPGPHLTPVRPFARIVGVVLAGGLGRRMGRDKATVELRGRSLLSRTCDRLAPQCADLAVSRSAEMPDVDLARPIIVDRIDGRAGPLAGVLSALEWLAEHDGAATHVATVPVDTPFLPHDFVARLGETLRTSDAAVACASSGGRVHPASSLWSVTASTDLRRCLVDGGIRRLSEVLDRLGYVTAAWATEPYDPFHNINTPDDLATAEAIAALDRAPAQ